MKKQTNNRNISNTHLKLALLVACLSVGHAVIAKDLPEGKRYALPDPSSFITPFRKAFEAEYEGMYVTDDQLFQIALESKTDVRWIEGIGRLYIITLKYRDSGGEYMRGASGIGPFMLFRRTETGLQHVLSTQGDSYSIRREPDNQIIFQTTASFGFDRVRNERFIWQDNAFQPIK